MQLHVTERQTGGVRVVLAVVRHARAAQFGAPRRERQAFLEAGLDVPERRLHRRARWRRRRPTSESEDAGVVPDPGEIGHAISGARRRRGQSWACHRVRGTFFVGYDGHCATRPGTRARPTQRRRLQRSLTSLHLHRQADLQVRLNVRSLSRPAAIERRAHARVAMIASSFSHSGRTGAPAATRRATTSW